MRGIKIAVVGAGSFVFSTGLLNDLIVEGNLDGAQLVLMDTNEEAARLTADVARVIAREVERTMDVQWTSNRAEALKDADFVFTSVAIQLHERYATDVQVLRRYGIEEITSECGGVGGISYALRSIPLLLDIARDMEHLCPDAWLLNVSNPLTRVMNAISRHTTIRCVGFCNVSSGGMAGGYHNIAALLKRSPEELEVLSAGLNHFNWLLAVTDKETGENLLAKVNQAVSAGGWNHHPLSVKLWRAFGYLPLAGDTHIGEFFAYDPKLTPFHGAHHGGSEAKRVRFERMRSVIEGHTPWKVLLEGRSWERPGLVVHALLSGKPLHLEMVNLPNQGCIANLPDGEMVEVPATVQPVVSDALEDGPGAGRYDVTGSAEVNKAPLKFSPSTIIGAKVGVLPGAVGEMCAHLSRVHRLVSDAAVKGDREILEEAIWLDAAIADKHAASRALDELLIRHRDVLPQFAM